jgi:chromosomal replication initiator protein
LNSADFARAYAHAVETDALNDFRAKHRQVSLLAIDDLHHLDGKEAAQLELTRTLDELRRRDGLLWAASRHAPGELNGMTPALASRLSEGLVVPLQPPAAAARRVILERLAKLHGVELPEPVVELLIRSSSGGSPLLATAPELNHALLQLRTESQLARRSIDASLARRIVDRQRANGQPSMEAITTAVCRYFNLTAAELKSPARRREVVRARGVAILLTRRLTDTSLEQLGRQFGGRDHTTVLHACRKTEALLKTDAAIRQAVDQITRLATIHKAS